MNKKTSKQFQSAVWAGTDEQGRLTFDVGALMLKMQNSDGTAQPLVKENGFGADMIRFAPDKGVQRHVHDGAHILFVVQGTGILEYEDEKHDLFPGFVYLIPGNVAHAIHAKSELTILAVGNDHFPPDSMERMTPAPK